MTGFGRWECKGSGLRRDIPGLAYGLEARAEGNPAVHKLRDGGGLDEVGGDDGHVDLGGRACTLPVLGPVDRVQDENWLLGEPLRLASRVHARGTYWAADASPSRLHSTRNRGGPWWRFATEWLTGKNLRSIIDNVH